MKIIEVNSTLHIVYKANQWVIVETIADKAPTNIGYFSTLKGALSRAFFLSNMSGRTKIGDIFDKLDHKMDEYLNKLNITEFEKESN